VSNISGISGSSGGLFGSSATSINNTYATTAQNANNGPFANLDLTAAQKAKIQKILQDAQSEGLTPSQVQAKITSVLTPSQQATLQQEQSSIGQSQQQGGPFANLNLSSAQQTQIQQILQKARNEGLSQAEVQAQINAVLTPAQQATLQQNVQNQGQHHRHGASNSGSSSSDTDEFGIPVTLASASSTSASAISNIAASYSVQSQVQDTVD